ncbi:MAG TPA: hypothetical protein VL523_10755 [Terriglobia bacterium]|nr:hypothetical protein [Terriglobia bacterium]
MAVPAHKAVDEAAAAPRPPGSRLKRAAFAVLFGAILLIPRLRRLRRRPAAWACLRLAAVAAGGWLVWRFARGHGGADAPAGPGIASLLAGMALAAIGLLVRARPEAQSLDAVARELNALVVLNGGSFVSGDSSRPVPHVNIVVSAERLTVLTRKHRQVAEIPLAAVRELSSRQVSTATKKMGEAARWELAVSWNAAGLRTSRFVYDGFFAEHLARVAEQTIASQWKKELPVLKP